MQPEFETFRDTSGAYRWRLRAGNRKKVATSGEAFSSHAAALRAARRVKEIAPTALLPGDDLDAVIRRLVRRRRPAA